MFKMDTFSYLHRKKSIFAWRSVTYCKREGYMYYNPGQSIWKGIEKSSKIEHYKKSLISTFVCFWLLLPKFNFWKRDEALGYVSTRIWDSLILPYFLISLSLNSFGNSTTKFAILDMMLCFTCGWSDLH